MKDNIVLFFGAGFSKSAGLPLVSELFKEMPTNPGNNKNRQKIYEKVLNAWNQSGHTDPEIWLKQIYLNTLNGDIVEVSFDDIRDFILARVVMIPQKYGSNGPYYYGISTNINVIEHQNFWRIIRSKFNILALITTNYDIVIEQGFRNSYSSSSNNRQPPQLKYGGYPDSFVQVVRIMTTIGKGNQPSKYRKGILNGPELFKLHGSVNWVEESHGFKIHDDVRAVYRTNRDKGKPRIIPPLLEKKKPEWAHLIWVYALKALKDADNWFICGYSFPEYDHAVVELFKNASKQKESLNLIISDPKSDEIEKKFSKILEAKNLNIIKLSGLPEVLDEL